MLETYVAKYSRILPCVPRQLAFAPSVVPRPAAEQELASGMLAQPVLVLVLCPFRGESDVVE